MHEICRVCGNKEKFSSFIAKDYFLGSKENYNYILCPNCNSLSLVEIPNNLADLYKNYYSFKAPKRISTFKKFAYQFILNNSNFFSKKLSSSLKNQDDLPIKSFQPIDISSTSKILDVGCGAGALLELLYDLGYKNCLGIDPFLEADIQKPSGLSLKKLDFFELDEKFDLIMFHHVFEHFPNPKDVLKHIYKLLNKNGICIVRIPDIDSYSFLRYKENWFSIHAPFHISLPSRKGMSLLAKDAGLVIKDIVGEQLVEFFLYSIGHELGVADYEKNGNRRFIESHGIKKAPPLHIKNELKEAKQRLKQVRKYDLCDWSIYYIEKSQDEVFD